MKKWIYTLTCLGYLTPSFATQHDSFLVPGEAVCEMSFYDHALETPNFFTRTFPLNMNPNCVLVPRTNSGFMVGLTGFYERPFDNQLDYAIVDPQAGSTLVGPNSTIQSRNPHRDFGFGAYLGYIFPYTGRDLKLDGSYISGDRRNRLAVAPSGGTLWTPLPLYDLTTQALTASSVFKPRVGQAILTLGQRIFGGTRFRLHPAMGIKYATIDRVLDTTYTGITSPHFIPPVPFQSAFVHEKSLFNGGGPAVQIDATYYFTKEFGITGHLTNAILIGNIQSQNKYIDDISSIHDTIINLKSTTRTVPNVDGKLGIVYEHQFCGSLYKLDIELGYEFNHFFNAFDNFRSAGTPLTPISPVLEGRRGTGPFHIKGIHDLTLDGPYLSVGVSGIACPNDAVIDPLLVTVPRLAGGFVFGLGAAYWQIQHNQQDYAILDDSFTTSSVFPSLNSTLKNFENKVTPGGLLRLGYIFNDTPYDVMFNYEQNATTHRNVKKATEPLNGVIWPILAIPFAPSPSAFPKIATTASANLNHHYSAANLELGQTINADSSIWLRIFEGVQYAHINANFDVAYNFIPVDNIILDNVIERSHFNGIGPRLGLDLAFPVGGFALTSQLAGGFLLGTIDSTFTNSTATTTVLELGTGIDSERQFVPFLDLKVGLAYSWNFFGRTKWTLDLGYMATHYFNAATTFRHATNNAAVFVKQVDDVTIDGPYVNLTVYGFGTCPPDCCVNREPFEVMVPELPGGIEFAAELLYLQTHVANIDYGIVDPTPFLDHDITSLEPSSNSRVKIVTPNFSTGYQFHLGYIFPLSANDLSINYTNFKQSSSNIVSAPPDGRIWTITNGNFGQTSSPPTTFFPLFANTAKADAHFKWRTGNIEAGRRIKFHHLMTRFFAGLAYARVNENININYLNGVAADLTTLVPLDTITQKNNFTGFGTRLGAAADLGFGYGFSLVGQIATDLLAGRIDTRLTEINSAGNVDSLNPDRRTRLVPAVDAKLGIAVTVPLQCCTQASIEAGYQVNHYFNVKDSLRFTDYFSSFAKQDQDIGFDGPYVRLQVIF